jgi:3-methyladenine DNA glycosylase AlkD
MEKQEVLIKLKSLSNKKDKKGMICFGIQGNVWGVPMPKIRGLAKDIGKKHFLAKELVKSKIHEAIILASLVAEIDKLTLKQMDS